MRHYGWTEDYVKFGITGAKGWVFCNWAFESECALAGKQINRVSDGYIKQHWKKLLISKQNGARS